MYDVLAGYLFKSCWPAMLSSSIAVWWVMGRGWLGLLCGILSAGLSFFMTRETVSVPAAMIIAYLAITKSFITGAMLKSAFVVRPFYSSVCPSCRMQAKANLKCPCLLHGVS